MNTVKLPDGQATDLIRRGNLEGDWSPFLTALRSGSLCKDFGRIGADGRIRPTLLTMILIRAPMAVIDEAISLGVPVDADHLVPAVASGDQRKLARILSTGAYPSSMSMAPEYLLLVGVNGGGGIRMLELVWSLREHWDSAHAREALHVFDCALRCQHPMPLLRFLLARGIGPSTRLLSQGVAANALPLGVAELLVRHGWPLPPTADPCPCVASMASPRLH